MENPFFKLKSGTFQTPDQTVPFGEIRLEHYLPAVHESLTLARQNLQAIRQDNNPATFENTIIALENCSEMFEVVNTVFSNLLSAEAPPEHHALAKEISPLAAAFSNEITLDPVLFQKVHQVFQNRTTAGLNTEQKQLVEKYHKNFVRNGANLPPEKKEKLKAIDQELSVLAPQFSENVLKATNQFELWITDKKELEGLPADAIEAAQIDAKAKGNKGGQYLFTLQAPSFIPFMQYSNQRHLREKIWKAYNSRAFKGEISNEKIVIRTVQLRHERAQLLGFKTHADFTLQERMAETPAQVFTFLDQLLSASKTAAENDLKELREFAKTVDGTTDLQPWDFAYYTEKLKTAKYSFNEEDLKPYFQLENVIQGVFNSAEKLYGLTFEMRTDIPVYHPDVQVYQVRDKQSGENVGLFYTDFFPRETKSSGAWMTNYREQGLWKGQVVRPHVSIVCNFTKPTATKPSLLTYDEVKTLYHEFGHSLHSLLSKCNYRTLSGTNVYWDFVELPSQIMENWVSEKEGLDLFARHYQTGEKIPAELVEKLLRSQKFQAGYACLRQVNFALMDMKWHTADPSSIQDVDTFEQKATAGTRVFPLVPGTNSSCGFSHIFAGGYSAGYYSYKWAEVLDADAFEYFKEKGIFNSDVAKAFKENILSRGGTEHPMQLYKKFRGREPDPKALLRRDGLTQ